jgi:NAD(P)-dependent dehydrogenase (short-subunit alcohol dehydrogenase family)
MDDRMDRQLLAGRVALITGGGGEIGGAIARRFAREGASVVVADLRPDKAEAVAEDIRSAGGETLSIDCDVAGDKDAERAVREAVKRFGKLTTLVNVAAAVTPDGTVETLTLQDWNHALAINLTGPFLMCKYAVPHIRSAGGGTIINVASQLGQIGVAKRAPYASSKAALIQFTRCLAIDHAPDNIRVNSLSPGSIDTERTLRRFAGDRAAANRVRGPNHLLGRTGRPDEIAAGALFLASDESSFMTGADLLIDGGYLAFKGSLSPAETNRAQAGGL